MSVYGDYVMFTDTNILLYILFTPLLGVFFAFILQGRTEQQRRFIKLFSLFFATLSLLLSLALYCDIYSAKLSGQFVYQIKYKWFEQYNINFHLGVDSISTLFILLTTFLVFACFIYSYRVATQNVRNYFIVFFLLEFLIIGSFMALDLLLFYVFFESSLIPMFFLIVVWGGKNCVYAGYKFFLYTLAGSVFLLMVIVYVYLNLGTLNIPELSELLPRQSLKVQQWLWAGMFISFAIKTPMWPVHTWLPDAHVQAPTAGSMVLAGILLKMGGYGFVRFSIPMLPQATEYFQSFVFCLSVVAVIYTSLVAFAQKNMKKLVAYSSIAHMGYVTLGLFSGNIFGITGAMFQMISHGLVSAALFLAVGILSDITGSKDIKDYSGLASKMPFFAIMLLFVVLSSIGLPATSGFVGEFLILLGAYSVHKVYAFLATTGVVLSAIYMLWLYKRVMLGKFDCAFVGDKKIEGNIDLQSKMLFVFFVFLIVLLGVYPSVVTDVLSPDISGLVERIKSYGF